MNADWKDFGPYLKELRHGKMSRGQLAEQLQKKVSTIAAWEQGHRRPKLISIRQISTIFGIDIQILQSKAGYTPEFDWRLSQVKRPDKQTDILSDANEEQKEELRGYLYYLRFKANLKSPESIAKS